MALISFNELTTFALRLVNLYYHNTTTDVRFEPMSGALECERASLLSGIVGRMRRPERGVSMCRVGRLGLWSYEGREPIAKWQRCVPRAHRRHPSATRWGAVLPCPRTIMRDSHKLSRYLFVSMVLYGSNAHIIIVKVHSALL